MAVAGLNEIVSSAHVVALPFVVPMRGQTIREAVVFRGPEGWAEFAPFAEYDDAEAAIWLAAAIDFGWTATPELTRNTVRVNATVGAVPSDEIPDLLTRFPGCRTAKIKVASGGETLGDDIARVRATRSVLGTEGRIRVDANGGWNVDEAEHAIRELSEFDIEYVEQPCKTVPELVEIRKRVSYLGIPIAADESVRRAEDPLAVVRAGAADVLVVKAGPLGGIRQALAITGEAGVPCVVSSAFDTSIGLSMGAYLAATIPDYGYDCGLGTAVLLAGDVTTTPLHPVDGSIEVRRVEASPELLKRWAAPAERRDFWLDRLIRCYDLL